MLGIQSALILKFSVGTEYIFLLEAGIRLHMLFNKLSFSRRERGRRQRWWRASILYNRAGIDNNTLPRGRNLPNAAEAM